MNSSNKKILMIASVVAAASLLFFGARYFVQREELAESQTPETESEEEGENGEIIGSFVQCLSEAGMKIYGSSTCPACASLVSSFGGYGAISPIYVECSQERDRCVQEMQTNYVPEIQVEGEVYTGSRDLESLSEITGCEI